MARSVTPRIAGLRPGTSPPPVRMPMTPFFVLILAINCRFAPLGDVEPEIISLGGGFRKRRTLLCLSSIILSPLNSNVKMSLHETGDIHVESEGTAASERDQRMHQGRHGVCQRHRTPLSERAPSKALEETLARSRGGGAGSRQPRPAQPPSTTRAHPSGCVAPGSHQVCRLQRPPSLRKTL